MSVPTIDPESSVLSYPQWQQWEHTFSATNLPYRFDVTSGAFPTGMDFQPLIATTGANSGDVFTSTAHKMANGTMVAFDALSSTSLGVNQTTRYFLVNVTADTYQVSATLNGAPIALTGDITSGFVFRVGYLVGTPSIAGISKVRITATNGSGDSAEVLFTIGTEPAAGTADGINDLVWDLGSNTITQQNTSVVTAPATAAGAPVLACKGGDHFLTRLRILKGGTFVRLDASVDGGGLRLVAKQFEPESPVFETSAFQQVGDGSGTYYLLYGKFTGTALAGALADNEADKGTLFDGVAEIEIKYENPTDMGDAVLVRTSATFTMRIERDIASN